MTNVVKLVTILVQFQIAWEHVLDKFLYLVTNVVKIRNNIDVLPNYSRMCTMFVHPFV